MEIGLLLVRIRDKRALGTLSLIRDNTSKLYDDQGQRLINPVLVDTLIVTHSNATGEQVSWHSVPMESLLCDHSLPQGA